MFFCFCFFFLGFGDTRDLHVLTHSFPTRRSSDLFIFWFWVVGFWVAFTPLYILGLMGVTRRMRVFDDPSLQIWFVIAGIGAAIVAAGIGAMLVKFAVSIWRRKELRDTTNGDRQSRRLNYSHYCAYRMPTSDCKKKNIHKRNHINE